jgi:hypothetical protein
MNTHEFKVNPAFEIDISTAVVITAYCEGETQLEVRIDFSDECHKVEIIPLNNCLSGVYQLELAYEAAAWFDLEFFGG